MAYNSKRLDTDAKDTIYLTRYNDGSIWMSVIDSDKARIVEIELSKRDVEELSAVIRDEA